MFSKKTCRLAMWSSEVVSVTAARLSVAQKRDLQKPSLVREGGRQIVKSSATLFRNEINRRKIIETFTRTSIDETNHS